MGTMSPLSPLKYFRPPLRPGPLLGAGEGMLIVLVSIITAPVCARARPLSMDAPVSRVMLAYARILPSKAVAVPRVAELPTCQNRPSSEPPLEPGLMIFTEAGLTSSVMSVVPIWKTQ